MNVNGSLIFDDSSASEIKNLRLQKLSTLPLITDDDIGRVVYNTASNSVHIGANISNVLSWITLASGSDAAAIMTEVDRIETLLGLNSNGTFNASAFTGNLANQTSYVSLITTLQGLLANATSAITQETTNRIAQGGTLSTKIDELKVALENSSSINATNLSAETSRATAAETVLSNRIDSIGSSITSETTRVNAALATEATTRADSVTAVNNRLTQEITNRTDSVNLVSTNLTQEITNRIDSVNQVKNNLDTEIATRAAENTAIRSEMASAIAGLAWIAPVDFMVSDHTTVTNQPVGTRVLDLTSNKVFTTTANGFDSGKALINGSAFVFTVENSGYTFNGTSVVKFNNGALTSAGNGLVQQGNTINIASNTGSITVTADSIDVSTSVLSGISNNTAGITAENNRAVLAEQGLGSRIDGEITARTAAINSEVTARDAAIAVEKNRAQTAESSLNTKIDAEISARDAAISTAISSEVTARNSAIAVETTRATGAEAIIRNKLNSSYFLYTSSAANNTHQVVHNIGQQYCVVTVIDSNNKLFIPESVTFNSSNILTVTFNTSMNCKIIVMGIVS